MITKISDTYNFANQAETEKFARNLSLWARAGMAIALHGELGSGKSTFARAFIRALAKSSDDFDIPSPTFSLIQTYDVTRVPAAHVDLYRLSSKAEAQELGLIDLLADHIVLIEWPELIEHELTASTIHLTFSGSGETRQVQLRADGHWKKCLERDVTIQQFLQDTIWQNSERKFFEGDASSRRYETLNLPTEHVILMDMPQRPDGPAVRDGKPYSAIAHLAEGITAVGAVNTYLSGLGYSAPKIEKINYAQGLAIIEDLEGKVYGRMINDGDDMHRPMTAAVDVLADMAMQHWPTHLDLGNNLQHKIEPYDSQAQLIEADLIVSWFWPYIHGTETPSGLNESFAQIWQSLLPLAMPEKPQWVLRDYHSPNLIWMPEREGIKRVGLIDTQDAVMGHAAYDLASMLQDARVDIDFDFADRLYAYYVELRHKQGDFDEAKFAAAYAVLGAQRATKILGIFARLAKRDGKPQYLKHMPRVSRYLARNLKHQALAPLLHWYEANLPEALKVGRT